MELFANAIYFRVFFFCESIQMTQWQEQREKGNFLGVQESAAAAAETGKH